jgi:hypothetical protein
MRSRSVVLTVALMFTVLVGGRMLGADEPQASPVTTSKSNVKVLKAGSPDSPGPPDSTFSLDLEDLYLRLTTGATGSPSAFTEPTTAAGAGTMHTIDEIMAVAPSPDNTTGALPGDVILGRTYWGLRSDGAWGPRTGNRDPCTTDSDSDGIPDCYDQCPADPQKGLPGTCGCGIAIADSDGDGVFDCVDPCPLPGTDPLPYRVGYICMYPPELCYIDCCYRVYDVEDRNGDGCADRAAWESSYDCDASTPSCL